MPRSLTAHPHSKYPIVLTEVATEEELLDFCNRVREAGGADVIDAFLPARPGISHSCLIANSLNFGCSVGPKSLKQNGAGEYDWAMWLPSNMTDEQRGAIAEAVGADPVYSDSSNMYSITLPKHIGNAAHAFDLGIAFQEYDKGPF